MMEEDTRRAYRRQALPDNTTPQTRRVQQTATRNIRDSDDNIDDEPHELYNNNSHDPHYGSDSVTVNRHSGSTTTAVSSSTKRAGGDEELYKVHLHTSYALLPGVGVVARREVMADEEFDFNEPLGGSAIGVNNSLNNTTPPQRPRRGSLHSAQEPSETGTLQPISNAHCGSMIASGEGTNVGQVSSANHLFESLLSSLDTNSALSCERREFFQPLQRKVEHISHEMEQVSVLLKTRGLDSYFKSLMDQFESLAKEFQVRLDGMVDFVCFLQEHNVAVSGANAGYFAVLPEEVILQILSLLDVRELHTMAALSTEWKRLAEDNSLWRRLCFNRWHKRKTPAFERQLGSWKQLFMRRARIDRNWRKPEHRVHTLEHGSAVLCVAFNENKIVSGSADETIKVWDFKTKKCLHTLTGHVYTVKSLQFDDDKIVSGGGTRDKTIKVWDINTGNCTHTIQGHEGGIFTLQYDADKIVSGATDHTIRVWSMRNKKCRAILEGHSHDVYCLQFDQSGRLVSGAGSGDKTVRVWDLHTAKCVQEIRGHRGGVFCLYFERNIVVSGSKGEIKVWDLNTGTCQVTLKKHHAFILGVQFDDTKMVSGGYEEDFAVKVWDWRMMKQSYSLKSHTGNIRCVKFDDNAIVSGAADKAVKIWDFGVN
eukprot:TRINITY_DN6085_c0_g2_i2.p1 TRINITY_DN6085_c0_g2~~TRINITY_DN6085_c0_g2_i2.p1  ORF type:complete len:652 (+),score=93.60 TRINITY_DN6085_c0_g2_i2:23-1978(+)